MAVPPGESNMKIFSNPDKFVNEGFPPTPNILISIRLLKPCKLIKLLFSPISKSPSSLVNLVNPVISKRLSFS
ncbi:hypothetical protein GCM10007962_04840 [Yeosuana aromativorans]|uniref:Uncharacterized protein n=1 Tax=Yeosuana aromativorans TaxID=288019 RepID=A0A8J3BH06_9FLAO|nr:hypothetical protein GCM10007962_04840 [Yeosuana aromativorans]